MFGWVTPNLSILLLKILNDLAIASSTSNFKTLITSLLVALILTLSFNWEVKITARPLFGDSFSYSIPNNVTKSSWLSSWAFKALEIDVLNNSSELLLDKAFKTSTTITSRVTFIPPFKSRPRFNSLCLQSA